MGFFRFSQPALASSGRLVSALNGLALSLLLGWSSPIWADTRPFDLPQVLNGYSDLVQLGYKDTLDAAVALQNRINEFLKAPSAEGLEAARVAWKQAREYYGQTEAFRFYGGPIDGENGPEGRMNAWPMDESYVDYVQGKPNAGLINNPRFTINRAALVRSNERGGEENVATGWHAIEFLLWGQDLRADGAGDRPHTDYIKGQGKNAERRARYLKEVTALLVADLTALHQAWQPERRNNYRQSFVRGGRESLRKILIGLGALSRGELAGERLEVAMFSQDQEDEQSCFSDNTHRDAVSDALGMLNVWTGHYRTRSGQALTVPAVSSLLAAVNPALEAQVRSTMEESVALASAIQAPFDQQIIGDPEGPGPQSIKRLINNLTRQSDLVVDAARALGIEQLNLSQP